MKKVRLLHKKLLIRRDSDKQDKTDGGIFLPNNVKVKKEVGIGTVIQGNKECRAGERVAFNKYAGTDIKLDDDKEYVALDILDIMALLED